MSLSVPSKSKLGFVTTLLISTLLLQAQPSAAQSSEDLPERLVIGMDGVSYYDLQRLQAEGLFKNFHAVSRAISTFPSLSDIAWADIFQTIQPNGYQRFHYSVRANRIVGGALSDLGNPIDYEKQMHLAFEDLGHHTFSYMFAANAAEEEIETITRDVLNARGIRTFYTYMLSTDTLQHTDGDIIGFLKLLNRKLSELQTEYRRQTGKELRIALLSDHGNTHHNKGIRVPVREFLEERGFRISEKIEREKDIVFTAAGILSSIAIFSRESQINAIVENIVELDGVDLISYVLPGDGDLIGLRNSEGEEALIVKREGEKKYSYQMTKGDPLNYAEIVARLQQEGKMDDAGFVTSEDWLQATSDHFYPAAVERIYRGHRVVTLNPARILVSLKDGYENANSLVKFMTHFKKRGGTHGALSDKGTNGILMTNYMPTRDLTTDRISDFLQLSELREYRKEKAGARFTDSRIIGTDLDNGAPVESDDNLGPQHETFLNLWDPEARSFAELGIETRYRFLVKHNGFSLFNRKASNREFVADSLPRTSDETEFRIPLALAIPDHLNPGEYFVKVYARRMDPKTGKELAEKKLVLLRFFTDLDGQVVAY
ncbi:MAG: hypothetical protein A2X94_13435 [Bdellovibrionales bacterium GWB1_55_8]|nr:MAG: hypothetical protein A2X94_13435 [Bdellovibrionales bacterium GWB1_55_8]